MKVYLKENVYEAALKRIERIFDEFDNIIVSFSGGKDSTAILGMCLEVARAKNRLPLKVMFIDQEDEWSYTIDYARYVKSMPEVDFYWFQVPLIETNAANHKDRYLDCWSPDKKDVWMREKEPDAITEEQIPPEKYKRRFNKFFDVGCSYIFNGQRYANIGGVRAEESLVRFGATTASACYKDITWGSSRKHGLTFYPIYDWTVDDVWIYIARNKLKYNRVYDLMFNYGINKRKMRVSSLHHETAYYSMLMLQELDRDTYNKMCKRLDGVSTFSQMQSDVMVTELPEMFVSWKEYRDYLLKYMVAPQIQSIFLNRWKNQNDEGWYKEHVAEILTNDTEGTKNHNFDTRRRIIGKKGDGTFSERQAAIFEKYSE